MRILTIVVVLLGLAATPARGATVPETGAAAEQVRWPYPRPRPFAPPPPPLPLTESEWSRWLLRAEARESHCGRIAFVSSMVAIGGLALAVDRQLTPSAEALAAGRTGKLDTFAYTLGAGSLLGGGLVFLGASQCASQAGALVRQLETEGRRRGYGPPRLEPLSEREWISRLASARGRVFFARRLVTGGTVAMLAGAYAIDRYSPPPTQRGAARLGPGGPLFFIGLGATIGGLVNWAHGAADVRALESNGSPTQVTWRILPRRSGVAGAVIVAF